jgi:hypothetical protein
MQRLVTFSTMSRSPIPNPQYLISPPLLPPLFPKTCLHLVTISSNFHPFCPYFHQNLPTELPMSPPLFPKKLSPTPVGRPLGWGPDPGRATARATHPDSGRAATHTTHHASRLRLARSTQYATRNTLKHCRQPLFVVYWHRSLDYDFVRRISWVNCCSL